MRSISIYKKNDRVWVRTYLRGVPGQIRPATVLSIVGTEHIYQPEAYIVVRFDDGAYPADDFECLPVSQVMGLREAPQDDDDATTAPTSNNNNEPDSPNSHEEQQP